MKNVVIVITLNPDPFEDEAELARYETEFARRLTVDAIEFCVGKVFKVAGVHEIPMKLTADDVSIQFVDTASGFTNSSVVGRPWDTSEPFKQAMRDSIDWLREHDDWFYNM